MQLGSATVKIVPDLSEFTAALEQIPDGFTKTEVIEYVRDEAGQIIRETRTTSISRG